MRAILAIGVLSLGISFANADPNDYSRVVAFGDSLSDNGNLKAAIGQPPAPYFDGRFSNGPTWIEIISNPAKSSNPDSSMNRAWGPLFSLNPVSNAENLNAAVGGAQTTGLVPPSVQTQIGAFVFTGGRFGSNDLVSVQGGANDFFNFFTPGSQPTATQITDFATLTAKAEADNVKTVLGKGAKTVIVSNLPDVGATPKFNGSQGASALETAGANLASSTYNATLDQETRKLAAANPNANLVQMDWAALLRVAVANPSAFGLTNVRDKCLNFSKDDKVNNTSVTPACAAAGPNTYLFWDDVHPTAVGHQVLARYATLLLSTEATGKVVSSLGQIAAQTRLEASDILFRRGAAPGADRPGGLYAEGIGQTASLDGPSSSVLGRSGVDYDLAGVRGGFDAAAGGIAFGSAVSYQGGDLSGRYLKGDLRTTQLDAYAMTRFSSLFAGVEGGVSFNEYSDLSRYTGIPTVYGKGSSRGVDYTVAATIGMQKEFGAITLTPAARIGYANINIDGYTEGAPLLALQYGDREISTGFYTVRLRAATPFMGYRSATVYGEVGYEDLFDGKGSYSAQLFNNTAKGVTIGGDTLDGRGLFVKAGVGGYIRDGIKLSGEYGYSNLNGNGDVHSGRLQITVPLGYEQGWKD